MIKISVSSSDIIFAKKQIEDFKKIKEGQWRYPDVEAWRGIVCEMLTAKWLEDNFTVQKKAKGLDNSGVFDDCDLMINSKKIEIKSATKNYFKYLMPKIYDIKTRPKDIYIGVKFNETVLPNEIYIIGYLGLNEILKYPIKQNKGAPYYEIPLVDLKIITNTTFT